MSDEETPVLVETGDRIIDLAADHRKGRRPHKSGPSALCVCSIATDTGYMESDADGPDVLPPIELGGRFKYQVGAPNGPGVPS